MRIKSVIRVFLVGFAILVVGISCGSQGGGGKKANKGVGTGWLPLTGIPPISLPIPTIGAAWLGSQAIQDISVMDMAQLGLNPSPEFQGGAPLLARAAPAAPPPENLPPNDPRWLVLLEPLRPHGEDEELPRLIEPLAAARYILATRPECATITETGMCPPDPETTDSTCTSNIVFKEGGCPITINLPPPPPPPSAPLTPPPPPPPPPLSITLVLSGALEVVATVTQAGTPPNLKGSIVVTSTNFRIADPVSGFYIEYDGTVQEDFDGTTPSGGFTVTHSSPTSDPLTITDALGLQVVLEGTRTIKVVPHVSLNIIGDGDVTITPPLLGPITFHFNSTKTADFDGTVLTLTLNRTITSNGLTFNRTVNVTLTPSGPPPVTSVTVNGSESFTAPLGITVTTTLNGVVLDLSCRVPRGGSIVIQDPIRTVTITFDTNCNCIAAWSDDKGQSGTLDLCHPPLTPQ